jgi:hypothetical protein
LNSPKNEEGRKGRKDPLFLFFRAENPRSELIYLGTERGELFGPSGPRNGKDNAMPHYFDDATSARLAAHRAAIDVAERQADTFARSALDPAGSHLAALIEGRDRLGSPPTPDAFASAAEWRDASDRHTFALSRYGREIAEAEARLDALREEHAKMVAEVPALKEELWRSVALALDEAVVARMREAAEVANLRQSLLSRVPLERHPAPTRNNPTYKVSGGGFPDISFFQANVQCDGFAPAKSAALVADLGLF